MECVCVLNTRGIDVLFQPSHTSFLPSPPSRSMETLFAAGTSTSDSAPIADYFSLSSRCCAFGGHAHSPFGFLEKIYHKNVCYCSPVHKTPSQTLWLLCSVRRGMRTIPERVCDLSWCCVYSDARDIHYRLCCAPPLPEHVPQGP